MGKLFQNVNYAKRKIHRGINARKVHRDINARKVHRDINARKVHRALGIVLAVAVVLQTMYFEGITLSASESIGSGLCEHHTEHTPDCGYQEAEPGAECTHEHNDDCYKTVENCIHEHTESCYPGVASEIEGLPSDTEEKQPTECSHSCSEDSGCVTRELDCRHEHDDSCGFREEIQGSPCTFLCEICGNEASEDSNNEEDSDAGASGTEIGDEIKEPGNGQTEKPGSGQDEYICKHHQEHTDDCGYIPATEEGEGTPCSYECRICPVEELIAALPDAADIANGNVGDNIDEIDEVRAQLEKILALFAELSEEEQGQVDVSRCLELQSVLDGQNNLEGTDQNVVADGLPGSVFNTIKVGGINISDPSVRTSLRFGEGEALWSPDTATLTLNNVRLTDAVAIISGSTQESVATINLVGENTIDMTSSDDGSALITSGNLVINADEGAKLCIITRSDISKMGINGQEVCINGGEIQINGYGWSIYGQNAVNIFGGMVTVASNGDSAIFTGGNICISGEDTVVDARGHYCGMQAAGDIEIAGGNVTAESTVDNALFTSGGNIRISGENTTVNAEGGYYCAMQAAYDIEIAGGNVRAESTNDCALFTKEGKICIFGENTEVNATGFSCALLAAVGDIEIAGGNITAESENNSAVVTGGGAIYIQGKGTEVNATGYHCALQAASGVQISGAKVTGYSKVNHTVYTLGFITIQDAAEVMLTAAGAGLTGLFLNDDQTVTIADSTVGITVDGTGITSRQDVSITDSIVAIGACGNGNGIVANDGTLSIGGDKTSMEIQSLYPLYGAEVTITGGNVRVAVSEGPAISGMNGITVSGGEVHAKATGTRVSQKPAAFYSSLGNITFTGEGTVVEAVSEGFRAVYTDNAEKGIITLNARVAARAGAYYEAFMAYSNAAAGTPDPESGIIIGERYSAGGFLPVTTKWKMEDGKYRSYTVLAPARTENLQEEYLKDLPESVDIVPALPGIAAAPDRLDFGSSIYGYQESPDVQNVTVTNTGNTVITLSRPAAENYTISSSSVLILAPGEKAVFSIRPKSGLSVGEYKETVRFCTDKESIVKAVETAFVVKKAVPDISAIPTVPDRVYNPSAALEDADLKGGIVAGVDGKALEGTWNWESTGTIPTAGNQGYMAVFTPTDTDDYETVSRNIPVTVAKAVPYIAESPLAAEITYGNALGDSLLTGGKAQYDENDSTVIPGSFAWKDTALKPGSGQAGQTLIFAPSDKVNYESVELTVTVEVKKADQETPAAPTAVEGNIKDTSITLTAAGENAQYSRDGTNWQDSPVFTGLSPNKAYTFYVRLKGDANHNPSPSSTAVITTRKIMLEGAVVTVSKSYTYTGMAIVPAKGDVTVKLGGQTIDASQYTISAVNNINAGEATVTVTATEESGSYSGAASTAFTIRKATVTKENLSYTAPDDLIYNGGVKTAVVEAKNLTGIGNISVKYKRSNVGELLAEAKQPGDYQVYAVIAEGMNYENAEIEMGNFTISYMPSPFVLYNGIEDKKEWYNADVYVTAKSNDYTVSDSMDGEYKSAFLLSAQEGIVTKTLYFMDEAGHISDGVSVTLKFDLTPPTGEIAVGAKWWQNVLHFISFGNYAAKEYTVTIKAEDKNGSGIGRIEYAIVAGTDQYTDAGALEAAGLSWTEYDKDNKPTVDTNTSQYVGYARLTDNVGNVTYISTDGILLDNTPPTVGSLSVPEDTKKDVTAGFTFTISEAADYYYVVLPEGSAAPSAKDIIVTCGGRLPEGETGTVVSGTFPKGSGAVSADTPSASVDVKDLSPNTSYVVYVTAVDRALDISNSPSGTPAGNIGNVAQADFTTKKTLPTITKDPAISGTYGQAVGEMTLTGGAAVDGKGTAVTGTWEVSSADKDKKPSAGTAEKVTVTFTPDSDSFDSVSVQIIPAVSPRDLNAPGVTVSEVAGTFTYNGTRIRPVVAVSAGSPASGVYISDTGAVLTGSDFTVSYSNNIDAGVKTASVAITGQGNYTSSVTKYFDINKAPGREVPDLRGSYTDNGQTYTYTITPTEGAAYRMGADGTWQEENIFDRITPGKSVTFYAKIPGDKNHEEGTPKSITVDFPKLTPSAPALSYTREKDAAGKVTLTITKVAGAEYSFDGGQTWTDESGKGGFTTSDTVTLAIRLKGTDTHNPSPARTMTVNLAKEDRKAPPAFSLKAEANGETDYTVTIPATEGCEYSFDGEHWSDINVKTGVNVGETVTGYKRYKETDEYNASSAVSDTKTMEKFTVKTPVISPEGGSYSGSISVTITCGSPDAEIYYTTDGSTPGRGSTRYTGAFTVSVPATVKAVAIKDGLIDSAIASAAYTKKNGGGSGGGGNFGGNENNGGSGGNDEGQGSGGNDSTNPGNGNTTPQPSVASPTDPNTNPGNGTAPGTGTTPAGPGSGNTARPGTAPGSGTETSAQGTKQPFIKGADGKIGWDVIRAEEEQAQEGSIINVDMNGSTVVPGDIFDSIKGKDITITFDMGSGIIWSVDGKSITTDKADDIDFSVQTGVNTVPVDIVNNVTGERYSIQMSLVYDGEFGFTAVLSINLGKENQGYTASLYYYNESTGELEFICSDEVAEDGTVSLAFTHASDYVIAIDGDEEEESGNATEPAQPEKQDKDSTGLAESPQTGQVWRPWWFIVAGALVIILGIGVFFVVKKKQEDENSGQ